MTSLHQETSSQLAGDWKLRQLGHDVLQEVPFSETIFLRNHDVIVTCFDATKDYFVFGTNLGCSFLIERKTNHVIKILCETRHEAVKKVKIYQGIDCEVAMATENGSIIILVFSPNNKSNKQQQMKFVQKSVHKSCDQISCILWSANGMKLFSSDTSGRIFQTCIDFDLKTASSSFVIQTDPSSSHQLDYRHLHLLISSQSKMFIFSFDNNDIIAEIEHQSDGCGACFNWNTFVSSQLKLMTSSSRLIRMLDLEGNLLDSFEKIYDGVKKINLDEEEDEDDEDQETEKIEKIKLMSNSKLLSYTNHSVSLMNLFTNKLIFSSRHLKDSVDVATTDEDEVFILLQNRRLMRISEWNDRSWKISFFIYLSIFFSQIFTTNHHLHQ